jgi:hypothetical protein
MKVTDRQIAVFGVIIATMALWFGFRASNQNKEIIAHTKDIKKNLA